LIPKTERFDTDVPWYLFVDIISRRKNGEKPFENLDIYPTAVKVCKGYAARAAKEGDIGKVRKYESYLKWMKRRLTRCLLRGLAS